MTEFASYNCSFPTPCRCVHTVHESDRSWKSSESALADLWQRTSGLPAPLVSQDGRRFRVLYPGRRSARAGPDFRDAILRGDDGRRVVGDVELHLRAPDWYSHSHHADPNYNGVVLHVVLRPTPGSDTRSRSGDIIPVVGLEAQAESLESAAATPPLPQLSEAETPEELADLLADAGDRRFLRRSAAFALRLETGDADQVLYAALMESLGYSANRRPFRTLAARLPFASLARLRSEPTSSRLLAIEAALVGASGLLPRLEPPDHRELVRRTRTLLPRARTMSPGDWTHFRVRPTNHPVRRVLGAARILDRYLDSGLARGLQSDAGDGDTALLARRLAAPPYVGESRARDVVVNVALPFLHAFAGAARCTERQAACLRMYAGHPKLSENEITREAMRMLPDWGRRTVRGARRQQGLMLLYERMTAPREPSHITETGAIRYSAATEYATQTRHSPLSAA